MAQMKGGGGNYQSSIVDLLKLLDLDSSLAARKELAEELGVHAGDHGPCALFGHRFTVGKLEGRQRQLSFQGSRNASRPGYAKRPAQRPAIVLGEDA